MSQRATDEQTMHRFAERATEIAKTARDCNSDVDEGAMRTIVYHALVDAFRTARETLSQ
jgi:hypothetical protein